MTGSDLPEQLLTAQQAAAYLNVSMRTFYSWRYDSGNYPPPIHVGKHLRYRKSEIDAWLDERTERPGRVAEGDSEIIC